LQELEFGREKDFCATNNASPMHDQNIDGIDCTVQSLQVDGSAVALYLRRSDGSPFQASISNPRGTYAVRFEKYEIRSQFDPLLFIEPQGAKITEAK
jgi:hypothetical protein